MKKRINMFSKGLTAQLKFSMLLLGCMGMYSVTEAQDAPAKTVRPNIIWIVCEDMSLHLSCFGEKEITTPNLDALAGDGVRYTNAFTCAGVCAPSRNGIITGMYPIAIGGDNMRNYQAGKRGQEEVTSRVLPSYSIVPPSYVKCFPEYLRKEQYYCTNNPKEDYQFEAPVTVWDESSNKATYRNRPDGKPFFAIFNLGVTHESQVWLRDKQPLLVDPANVIVPPYYPDIPEVRHDIARNLSNVIEMDRQAGVIINELKEQGLYDNSYIFFYSDHGDGLPFVKREITKRGLWIPLIIKFPGKAGAGTTDNQLVSGVDFGPTVLSLAGVTIPAYMQGQAFLGEQKANVPRKYIFAARDRMDAEVDRVRSVFDGRFQYIKNYMPEKPWYQPIVYRLQQPMMRRMLELKDSGRLNSVQLRWFASTKPVEELYDTEKDPHQLKNLASDPAYKNKLNALRQVYTQWINETGDLHSLPEIQLRNKMWNSDTVPPATAMPVLKKVKEGYIIECATAGASIGIKQRKAGEKDFPASWKVYHYGILPLEKGSEIQIRAQRIGYTYAETRIRIDE